MTPVPAAAPTFPLDKRWDGRRERWVAPGAVIRPTEYGVDVAPERDARRLVVDHHYSGSFPAARLSVGLYRRTGVAPSRLVGIAVFSVPMNGAAVTAYSGLAPAAGVELGRFICLPEVAHNGESWFLARALDVLRGAKPEVRAIVSYADPVERTDAAGALTKPAHAGSIYQASNAAFAGRGKARWLWLTRDGQVVSERALSKIRRQDQGHRYAAAQLVAAGADARQLGEDPAAWLARVLQAPTFRRVRHPGNFVYLFGLDRGARTAIADTVGPRLAYPKLQQVAA